MRNRPIFLFFLLLLFSSCTIRDKQQTTAPISGYAQAYDMINNGLELLQDGDLVVRAHHDLSSQFIRQLSRQDKHYSHAGIVQYQNGYPFIYHIVAGDENPDGKLLKDSLLYFANPRTNDGFAIYRYDLDEHEKQSLQTLLQKWYQQGLSFDYNFDIENDDKMYCSEMIKKLLSRATNNRIQISTTMPTDEERIFFAAQTKTKVPRNMPVVAIDNLYLNKNCHLVKQFNFYPEKR